MIIKLKKFQFHYFNFNILTLIFKFDIVILMFEF